MVTATQIKLLPDQFGLDRVHQYLPFVIRGKKKRGEYHGVKRDICYVFRGIETYRLEKRRSLSANLVPFGWDGFPVGVRGRFVGSDVACLVDVT